MRPPRVTPLAWADPPLGEAPTPRGSMRLTLGVGSGLARRPGDPPGRVWGLGDRGPNLKIKTAIQRYGLSHLEPLRNLKGAKVLPLPDFQPVLAELQVHEDRVELMRVLPLRAADGPLSGRALPGSREAGMEPTFDLAGERLAPDPRGADTEGVAALADGGFWVSEEYGPSLLRIGPDGMVSRRLVPEGLPLPGAEPVLPPKALSRRLNRGFEGLAISPDERWLYVVFQSAPERTDPGATVIWKLDAETGALAAAYDYPFDPPESFPEDEVSEPDDLKACELLCVGPDRLLVLERVTRSARIYEVEVKAPGRVEKRLRLSTDDQPGVAPDLEGMCLLAPGVVLLATDNDFGVEGAATRFYRLEWDPEV